MANISIIVPVYNMESYIEECINSIMHQTIKEIEIIIVDDGSTDSTVKIVENLMAKNKRIRLLRQQHGGAGLARNKGLEVAKGKYVAFCDADDFYYDEDALEEMINACENNEVHAACGSYMKILENGVILEGSLFKNLTIKEQQGIGITFEDYQNDYNYQSFIFSRDMLRENEIIFPDYLRYQDPPFLVKALMAAGTFWVVPVALYCYRFGHQDMKANGKKIKHTLMGIRDNLQIAVERGYDELYERLVEERLNGEYCQSIMENMSDDVVRLLNAIIELGRIHGKNIELKALNDYSRYQSCCELVRKEDAFWNLYNQKNQSFEIWRKTALLATKGIEFADILLYMGCQEIYVYGAGEIGQMFLGAIKDKIGVRAILDKTIKNAVDYTKDDLPIIVTPANSFQEISYEMIKKGVKRERLYSIHTLLAIAMKYILKDGNSTMAKAQEEVPYIEKKHFLITGAQFSNKGAQSMLFVAVSEIRKRFKEAIIWYLPLDTPELYTKAIQKQYDFMFLLDGNDLKSQVYEVLPQLSAIIDVSGYALSSYWENEWYMRVLRFAYHYGIPLYLMPQSFGPFDFTEEKQKELKQYLPYAKCIYLREQTVFAQMKSKYNLENIFLSKDLVLQNKGVDKKFVYGIENSRITTRKIDTKNNVAIVPNVRNYEFGSREQMLKLYKSIVVSLLNKKKNVYIVPHSNDSVACKDIYRMFKENTSVYLVEEGMDCIEFGEFIKNFEYIIASRFHAIVHAYKNGIPGIAIGWAEKYAELLRLFRQEKYLFDVREKISEKNMLKALDEMNLLFEAESETIKEVLPMMQADNCFDILSKDRMIN